MNENRCRHASRAPPGPRKQERVSESPACSPELRETSQWAPFTPRPFFVSLQFGSFDQRGHVYAAPPLREEHLSGQQPVTGAAGSSQEFLSA